MVAAVAFAAGHKVSMGDAAARRGNDRWLEVDGNSPFEQGYDPWRVVVDSSAGLSKRARLG
jgi:hypothetical protein